MTAALIFFITKVLCPPRRQGVRPLEPLARIRRLLYVQSRLARELILFGGALLFGLVVVPLLIWVVGNRMLGLYTHGANLHAGPMALLGDFYEGLSKGWPSFWIVALGPLVIAVFARALWELIVPAPNITPKPTDPKPPNPKSPGNKSNARIEPFVAKDGL